MFVKDGMMILRHGGEEKNILDVKKFTEKMGEHNLENLLATTLAVMLFDLKFRITPSTRFDSTHRKRLRVNKKMVDSLPQIPFRQEIIFSKGGLTVVNDSAGTSPDATIAILRRFSKQGPTLITGGTDKELQFTELAKEIKRTLTPAQLVLLNGSATKKLIKDPSTRLRAGKKIVLFETLEECVDFALVQKKGTILFSPGSASFEKFKNEFDRGEKFSKIILSQGQ